MKTILLAVVLLISTTAVAQQSKIVGTWLGSLNVGMELRIVFHFKTSENGQITAELDSPDQGAKGIPVSKVILRRDSVLVELEALMARYEGKLLNDTAMSGSWSQGLARFDLALSKVKEVPVANRLQTPKPPFAYQQEEVEFDNVMNSVHLAGTFTYPSEGGPFPTAILITGSGQQDRDETIAGHKPFLVIADHLTRNGMAVLRLDDRGAGKSTGDLTNATSADFANDIESALAYIKKHPKVDAKKIGLIGHSEGGLIASIVAARNHDIDFMILLAGPGVKGSDLLAGQAEAIVKTMGLTGEEAKQYRQLYQEVMHSAMTTADTSSGIKQAFDVYAKWKQNTPATVAAKIGMTSDEEAKANLRSMVIGFQQSWMKYFLQSDPSSLLSKTNAKVLALNGEKDVQVLSAPNLAGIKSALQKGGNRSHETKELKGLNHLFQTCKTCTTMEYGQLEETFAPAALQEITGWLKKHVMNN